MADTLMEKLVSLCKRRGFVFPGSEIYGGLNGTWDLGPLGVLLANNIKNEWWKSIVTNREDVVGLDSSILHHPKVWEASGHVSSFTDPLVECKICHTRFRADHKDQIREHEETHKKSSWTDVKQFNLMFKTYVGPVDNEENKTYLRPETAQGIFINFQNVTDTMRVKIPFGIAQIGKGFRNEITTGNFLFRVREFEMMELEYFVEPGKDREAHDYWKKERLNWWLSLGISNKNIKLQDLPKEEIAHYSKGTTEVWYNWPFAVAQGKPFGELEGIANRGDYDLRQHAKYSGRDFSPFPYVIEPSVGVGRAMLAFLVDSYAEDNDRILLKLHPKLAPYKIAVFPLLANKQELVNKAREVYNEVRPRWSTAWDDRGNIGKRYYSQDEIGTQWCVTVDFDSLKDNAVTVRDRNTTRQERMKIDKLLEYFSKFLN